METPAHTTHSWRFGVFEIDARVGELYRAGTPIKLRDQPFRILIHLLEHAGQLVTREELRSLLWPAGTFVDFDHSLNVAVMKLREVLGDTAEKPLYIETIPKRGYRFIAPLLPSPALGSVAGDLPDPGRPLAGDLGVMHAKPATVFIVKRRRFLQIIGGSALLLICASVVFWSLYRPLPLPRITDYLQLTLDGQQKDVIGTDGNSLFVNFGSPLDPDAIGQVSTSGGKIVAFRPDLPSGALVPGEIPSFCAVSPDGSRLLIWGHFYADELQSDLWVVGILGRPARLLAKTRSATWSPDGKQVLYASTHGDLYLISAEGGVPRMLATSGAPSGTFLRTLDLTWSPDGRRIRFTRDFTIWEMAADGSNLHQLLPGWRESHLACCGRWTPDGRFFMFLSGNTLLKALNFLPGGQIWALDERRGPLGQHNSKPFLLMSGPTLWGTPIPSRDGRHIFARGVVLRGELVRFEKQSNQLKPYLGGISAEYLTFSHDGQYVAYVSFPEGILYRANRDGTGVTQLTKPPFHPKNARWSPDDKSIVFVDYSPELKDDIYIISAQGGVPRRLVPDDKQPEANATWSPDSKRIAFDTEGAYSAGPRVPPDVRILNMESHEITTLPSRPGGFWSPRWSPDGRYIAGLNWPRTPEVIVFDLQKRQWRTVFQGADAAWPCWSHDGRFIYFLGVLLDGIPTIFRVPVTGGKPERVVDLGDFHWTGWYAGWFGLDPDDNPLFLRDAGTDEIYALTLSEK